MFSVYSIRKTVAFSVFAFLFLPVSIHIESLRSFVRQWISLLQEGSSLTDATRASMQLLVQSSPNTTAFITIHRVTAASPTCSITAPANTATVSGASVSVTASATGVNLSNVQFRLDGSPLGSADTSSPYGISWDTSGASNGTHSLSCTATNQYGETTTGAAISVTVNNDTTPPVRSNGAPSTDLPSGTTQTDISLLTDENATCKYDGVAGTAYASMGTTFTTTGSTTQSTNITSLSDGNTYSYYVRCQDTATNPNTDDYLITFSVLAPSGDSESPSIPANVIATPTATTMDLTWDASTDNVGVTGYKVFRDGIEIDTTVTASYTDSGLTPETTYSYEIAAYDDVANVSISSSPVDGTTDADAEAPTIPQNLIATVVSDTVISLAWDASTDNVGVTGYRVFRDTVEVGTTTGTTFSDSNLTASTLYSYEVSAYDATSLESAHSTTASATTSAASAQAANWEKKKVYEKPKRTLKNSSSWIARGETLIQSGRRFSKNAEVQLFFSRPDGTYYPPETITTDSKGRFSISYTVNKPAGKYKWYAIEVRTGRKSKKQDYTVYDPKAGEKPKKKTSSSTSTHSS